MEKSYFVVIQDQQTGPFSMETLKQKIMQGQIGAQTMTWCEGMDTWHPAEQITELSAVFTARTTPPPVPGRLMAPPPLPGKDMPAGLSPLEEKAYRFATYIYRPWRGKHSPLSAYVREKPKNAVFVSIVTIVVMIVTLCVIVAAFTPTDQQQQPYYQEQMMSGGQMPPANWQAGHRAIMDAQREISDMSHDAYTYRRDRQDKSDDLYRKLTYGADD